MDAISLAVVLFVGILTLISCFVLYMYRKLTYWKRKGIKSMTIFDVVNSIVYMIWKPLALFELAQYKKHGRIYGYYFGLNPSLMISEPDLIKLVFVKDFHLFKSRRIMSFGSKVFDQMLSSLPGNDDWKRIRSIMSPTFSSGKMRQMSILISECAKGLQKNLEKTVTENSHFDVKKCCGAFTMDVIASCAFGTKIESSHDPDNEFARNAQVFFNPAAAGTFKIIKFMMGLFFPNLTKFFGLKADSIFEEGGNFFMNITREIVKSRQGLKEKRNDFLQLVMDACKNQSSDEIELEEEDHYNIGDTNKSVYNMAGKSKSMSEDELISQCLMFFVVGYETTATAMSLTAFELAMNPDLQDRLCAEVDSAFAENDIMNFDVISKMEYLDQFFSETLRKYPPGFRIERTADEDYKIGDTGITVPKGTVLGVSVMGIHNDPEYYPDPDTFDPERFSPENRAARHPYAYLPFGAGPRNCIAMRFAILEAKMGVVHMLRRHRFVKHALTKIPLEFISSAGIYSPKDLILGVERR